MAWKILQIDSGALRAKALCGTPTSAEAHVVAWALVEDTVTLDREVQGLVLINGQLKLVNELSIPSFDKYKL